MNKVECNDVYSLREREEIDQSFIPSFFEDRGKQ